MTSEIRVKEVHVKHVLQAQLVLLKGQTVFRISKTVLASQDCVDSLCFVASQSEATIDFFHWCYSNDIRRFFHKRPHCLRQHKQNQNRLNRDWILFFTGGGRASCLRA